VIDPHCRDAKDPQDGHKYLTDLEHHSELGINKKTRESKGVRFMNEVCQPTDESDPRPRTAALLPAYNEERNIAKVLARASSHVDRLVVIDDGSEDDTGLIAEKLGALVIRHSRNLGKGAALKDGFEWARSNDIDAIVTIDADGQHDPEDIPRLLGPILSGESDIVVGQRPTKSEGMTVPRRFARKTLDSLTSARKGGTLVDSQSGFRAYSQNGFSLVQIHEWGMGVDSEILLEAKRIGLRIHQVSVGARYCQSKRSGRNPLSHFTDVISAIATSWISRRPLRTIGIPGLLLIGIGLWGWLNVIITYNMTREFAIGHALVYTAVFLIGTFAAIAAIVMFAVIISVQRS
jgi:glycosyltransferase involved in cell wall biosynthesis